MQKSWIHYTKELFVTQMNHWILVVAAMTVLSIFSTDASYIGYLLLLGIVPAFFYVLRLKVHHFFLFFFLHFLPFSVLFLCQSNPVLWVLVLIILLFHFIYSVKAKIKPTNVENPFIGPVGGVCCIAACTLLQHYYGKLNISMYYTAILFAFLLVFFFYYFMDHYLWFVKVQKNSVDNVSEQSLWRGGIKQLLLFLCITCISMLLLHNVAWLSYLFSKAGMLLTFILRFLFSLINQDSNTDSIVYGDDASASDGGGDMMLVGEETAPVWIVLEYIAIGAMIIGLIWLISYGLYTFFRFLWKNFHQSKKTPLTEPFQEGDVREQCEIIQNKLYLKNFFTLKNNRDIARKTYKKFITKHKQELIGDLDKEHLAPLTAGECCEKLQHPDVQTIYEKVRYSEEKISSADIKVLKEKTKQ